MFTSSVRSWYDLIAFYAFGVGWLTLLLWPTRRHPHGQGADIVVVGHAIMIGVLIYQARKLPWAPPADPQERRAFLRAAQERAAERRARRREPEATHFRQMLIRCLINYAIGVLIAAGMGLYLWKTR